MSTMSAYEITSKLSASAKGGWGPVSVEASGSYAKSDAGSN